MTLKSSPARIAAPNQVHMPHSAAAALTMTGCDVAASGAVAPAGAVAGAAVATKVAGGVYAANSSGRFDSGFVPAGAIAVSTLNAGRRGSRQTWSSQI